MNIAHHKRRFSMPPPGFVAANQSAISAQPKPPAQQAAISSLAQIYALAQQQALETVNQRQWDDLVRRLFDR